MLEFGVGSYSQGQLEHHNFGQQSDALPKSTLVPNEALVDGFEVYTNWRNIWTPCGRKMQHQTTTKPGQNNEQKQQTN